MKVVEEIKLSATQQGMAEKVVVEVIEVFAKNNLTFVEAHEALKLTSKELEVLALFNKVGHHPQLKQD